MANNLFATLRAVLARRFAPRHPPHPSRKMTEQIYIILPKRSTSHYDLSYHHRTPIRHCDRPNPSLRASAKQSLLFRNVIANEVKQSLFVFPLSFDFLLFSLRDYFLASILATLRIPHANFSKKFKV